MASKEILLKVKEPQRKEVVTLYDNLKVIISSNHREVADYYLAPNKGKLLLSMSSYQLDQEKNSKANYVVEYPDKVFENNEVKAKIISHLLKNVTIEELGEALQSLTGDEALYEIISRDNDAIYLPKIIKKLFSYSFKGLNLDNSIHFIGWEQINESYPNYYDFYLIPLFLTKDLLIAYNYWNHIFESYDIEKQKEIFSSKSLKEILEKSVNKPKEVIYVKKEKRKVLKKEEPLIASEEVKETIPLNISIALKNLKHDFRLNLNNTSKLIIEHIPLFKTNDSLEVIKIPRVQMEEYDLVTGKEIELNNFVLKVKDILTNKVTFEIKEAKNISDSKDNKYRKTDLIDLFFQKKETFKYVNEKENEIWTMRVEKSNFKEELRNTKYQVLLSKLKENYNYDSYSDIEKFETNLSLMLFLKFIMDKNDEDSLLNLFALTNKEQGGYEEYITLYNATSSQKEEDKLRIFELKKSYQVKSNLIERLITSKKTYYPRYIFNGFNYFEQDVLMKNFYEDEVDKLSKYSFTEYFENLFKNNNLFINIDALGKDNLISCLNEVSHLYKENPKTGEDSKYYLEQEVMNGSLESDLSLAIANLCSNLLSQEERDSYMKMIKDKYVKGKLYYPIYPEILKKGGDR